MLKKLMGLGTFFIVSLGWSQNHDPYNAYRFNRANWERGSTAVDNEPWYEWWYYKVVTPEGRSFFWVYGVINPADTEGKYPATKAYVEIGDFEQQVIEQRDFSVDTFQAAYDRTHIEIRNSPFVASDRGLRGEMTRADGTLIRWDVTVEKDWGWNAMGWGMPLNSLFNIAWYPAQASARMSGTIQWGNETIQLNNAKAYQDRNWGSSFPEWWYWLVANEFNEDPNAALACGGGMPRIAGLQIIPALTCGLRVDGQELEFRSNDFTVYDYEIRFGKWYLSFEKLDYKLVVNASAPREMFMDLVFLSPQNEEFHDFETLQGNMHVELYERKGVGWRKVKNLTSRQAGIEYGSRDPNPPYSTQISR